MGHGFKKLKNWPRWDKGQMAGLMHWPAESELDGRFQPNVTKWGAKGNTLSSSKLSW